MNKSKILKLILATTLSTTALLSATTKTSASYTYNYSSEIVDLSAIDKNLNFHDLSAVVAKLKVKAKTKTGGWLKKTGSKDSSVVVGKIEKFNYDLTKRWQEIKSKKYALNQSENTVQALAYFDEYLLTEVPKLGEYLEYNVKDFEHNNLKELRECAGCSDDVSYEAVLDGLRTLDSDRAIGETDRLLDFIVQDLAKLAEHFNNIIGSNEVVSDHNFGLNIDTDIENKLIAYSARFQAKFSQGQFRQIKTMATMKPADLWQKLDRVKAKAGVETTISNNYPVMRVNDDWIAIGGKPGGVEGGFTAKYLPRDLSRLLTDNPEARATLIKMARDNSKELPTDFQGKSETDLDHQIDQLEDQTDLALVVLNQMPTAKTAFMFKVMFGENDKKHGKYYLPNSLNWAHRLKNSRNLEQVNSEVLSEYASLMTVAGISSEIVPRAVLGRIVDHSNHALDRWCLGTEIVGLGEGEEFGTFDAKTLAEVEQRFGCPMDVGLSILAYGATMLLGDFDANSTANYGVLKKNGKLRPIQFDLGHPNPGKYVLDRKTFLPTRRIDHSGWGSLYFFVGGAVQALQAAERRSAFLVLDSNRDLILASIDQMIRQISDRGATSSEIKRIQDFRVAIVRNLDRLHHDCR